MAKSKTFTNFMAAYEAKRLLDLKMPDGRELRDFTADDCIAHSGQRDCGWLKHVGRRVRLGWGKGKQTRSGKVDRKRKVGGTFTEEELGWYFMAFHKQDVEWANFRDERPAPGDEMTPAKLTI
jgi:hypothetical protein